MRSFCVTRYKFSLHKPTNSFCAPCNIPFCVEEGGIWDCYRPEPTIFLALSSSADRETWRQGVGCWAARSGSLFSHSSNYSRCQISEQSAGEQNRIVPITQFCFKPRWSPPEPRSTERPVTWGCIVLYFYCGRIPAANAPGCTAAEGLLYKPWSLVVPTCTARCLHQRP